jgi:hypothetical protein
VALANALLDTPLLVENSATTTGMKWLGRVLAVITILVVSAFGDGVYIQQSTSGLACKSQHSVALPHFA